MHCFYVKMNLLPDFWICINVLLMIIYQSMMEYDKTSET